MPNHCTNTLGVESIHPGEASRWLDANFTANLNEGRSLDFNVAVPMPDELRQTQAPFGGSKKRSIAMVQAHGHDNWYNWACARWGTKWNAYSCDDYADVEMMGGVAGESCRLSFDTAWGPPEEWLREMAPQWPKVSFDLEWRVEGDDPHLYIEATE